MLQKRGKESSGFLRCGSGKVSSYSQSCSKKIMSRSRGQHTQGDSYTHAIPTHFSSQPHVPSSAWPLPHLKFSPPSATANSSPSGSPCAKRLRWAVSRLLHTSSSVYWTNGSRLARRVSENSTGSYRRRVASHKSHGTNVDILYSTFGAG